MTKIDCYNFRVLDPYKFGGENYKTLHAAKSAYKEHLEKGHKVGCCIYGCTERDTAISFTPWYYDALAFGRTQLTNIGRALTKRNKQNYLTETKS